MMFRNRFRFLAHRHFVLTRCLECVAERMHRAHNAGWRLWTADGCPQFHHCLIESPRCLLREKCIRFLLKLLHCGGIVNRGFHVKETRQNAFDVSINSGIRRVKGDALHRSRTVIPYTRQLPEGGIVLWHFPIPFLHDNFRRFMKVPGSAIVAQPFPEFQHGL